MPKHPYASLPARCHWRSISGASHPLDIADWHVPKFTIGSARIGTAGSCFAQHIGRQLKARGYAYLDVEPPPPILPEALHARFGYGMFSARYGNVYTTRQLRQLLERATGAFEPACTAWQAEGGWVDPFRPTIEPPLRTREEVRALTQSHLAQVGKFFREVDILVFTLGLTEAWLDRRDGAVLPVAPGVAGGQYDPQDHEFRNFTHAEVMTDLLAFAEALRDINPGARMILTVSPVPLMATATGEHVVVASSHSKSVLRGVAGEVAAGHDWIDYFPSYEIVSSHVMRGRFYNADLRTVHPEGVAHVMRTFFGVHPLPEGEDGGVGGEAASVEPLEAADAKCDEELIAEFGEGGAGTP
jgi:hypothetical protein